jgi:hypothetical protein
VAGISVAGASVAGISVAGASVAGISVATGASVWAGPQAEITSIVTIRPAIRLYHIFLDIFFFSLLCLKIVHTGYQCSSIHQSSHHLLSTMASV